MLYLNTSTLRSLLQRWSTISLFPQNSLLQEWAIPLNLGQKQDSTLEVSKRLLKILKLQFGKQPSDYQLVSHISRFWKGCTLWLFKTNILAQWEYLFPQSVFIMGAQTNTDIRYTNKLGFLQKLWSNTRFWGGSQINVPL